MTNKQFIRYQYNGREFSAYGLIEITRVLNLIAIGQTVNVLAYGV
jgi:hypothetical protein